MGKTGVITLDLNFQNWKKAIASYLVRYPDGAVLVESGPGSTLESLKEGLREEGLVPGDITHVLLTHIHLDHAGAAGWLSRQGAEIYVHPNGAPHLLNPEKLLASASRIYGDQMDGLWGEVLPVDPKRLKIAEDGQVISIGNLEFLPVNTPGHAEHHHAYLHNGLCFSGDIGGVRIPGHNYLRAPMPPPELHFGRWHESLRRLQEMDIRRIAPTHFGIYDDPGWQLREIDKQLITAETWLKTVMAYQPSLEDLREKFVSWMNDQGRAQGLSDAEVHSYALANPSGMSADGMFRYWRKVASVPGGS